MEPTMSPSKADRAAVQGECPQAAGRHRETLNGPLAHHVSQEEAVR